MALHRGYVGAKSCTSGPQTGARGFMSWFLAKYKGIGGQNSGIYNCRSVRGGSTTSLHGEGRAVDLGLKFTRAEFARLAELLRTHSKELGIQCIIYNRKIWSGGYSNTGWQKYVGVNPHTDHLHVEMTWAAAQMSAANYTALLERTIGKKVGGPGIIPQGNTSKPKPAPARVSENSGNSTAENKAIAELLNSLGFKAGVPDGVPGPYLRDGVKAYQNAQQYFPGMKRDGNWGPMTQAHYDWVRKELQPGLNKWTASQRVSILALDGSYGPLVKKCVKATQTDNYPLYVKAGGYYKDGEAGPITCKFLGIKKHPSA